MNLLLMLFASLLMQGTSLGGRVVKGEMKEPMPKVTLELRSFENDAVISTTVSRDDGTFSFPGVKAGKYRLRATRPGFVRIEYGQKKASGRGTAIAVDAGQAMNNLQIMMTPAGAVTGRIYDATGQPIVKATVQAMKVGYANGKRSLAMQQTALADDRGEYRLFYLPPGQYYISAVMPNWNIAGDNMTFNSGAAGSNVQGARFMSPLTDGLETVRMGPGAEETGRYLPVFFPNTTDEDAASPVEVGPAGTVSGIDIQLAPIRTRRVKGVVIDSDTGQPPTPVPQPAQLIVFPSTSGSGGSPFVDRTTGAFDIQIPQAQSYITASGGLKIGRVMVPAGDQNIENFRITISSGIAVNGIVKVEGTAPLPLTSLRILLRGEPQGIFGGQTNPQSGVVTENGSFSLLNVNASDFRINVTPLLNTAGGPAPMIPDALKNAYVKAITLGEVDLLNNVWHIQSRTEGTLQIVIANDSHKLSGIALAGNQLPAAESMVVLVPENRGRVDLYRSATSDANGNFKFDGVPPGNYKAFVWNDVETGAWLDPRFLQTFEERGTVMTMSADRTDLRLQAIP